MSSRREAADATRTDDPSESVCDRCGDPVPEDRILRLSVEPCPELAGRYEAVTATYCPDCVAGIGHLSFAARPRGHPPTDSE
ncbi:hypothetical protein [Natrarchaeobius chitinivorans]|uniref:Uncharacterized protein n=1 Tax=Natrarchaeobius chitinivorans TaxID=1679083 RepID=A0A3N6MEV0_NATCH|nr:hypothetical protein [Natrarchaeobius chitinivorans]RQG92396.1 hypothetical protein EA473_16600 [Natrarchaeobius chitinivorans]